MGLTVLTIFLQLEKILNNAGNIFISIVIPIHNEEQSLPQLMAEFDEVIKKVSCEIEVIFINDASTDGSIKIIEEFEKQYFYVKSISLDKKGGQTGCYQIDHYTVFSS